MAEARRRGFIEELKRRNVHRTVLAYGVGAWVLIQIAETVFPYIGLPDSAITFVIALVVVGLLPAVVVSWFFEISPDGIIRDDGSENDADEPRKGLRRFDYVMIGIVTANADAATTPMTRIQAIGRNASVTRKAYAAASNGSNVA